ncbi:hypothetical protein [Glycomyces rhizosphaerae]|uniref:Lipoprotein n=1 Tax=Glycomyces rhizosphaerae TaxID=2054422 RepID=A0ABV7PYT8_9ACTN
MPKPNRLAVAAAGLAVIAFGACSAEEGSDAAPDATTSEAVESAAPTESEPTDTGCDATFDPATDDAVMEPYVGEWISEEQAPDGADSPEASTVCIEADGTVNYETPTGIWEGHLTVGDESVPMMDLDQVEGTDGGNLLLDCNYTADDDTIGLVESGDDGRWNTFVRA